MKPLNHPSKPPRKRPETAKGYWPYMGPVFALTADTTRRELKRAKDRYCSAWGEVAWHTFLLVALLTFASMIGRFIPQSQPLVFCTVGAVLCAGILLVGDVRDLVAARRELRHLNRALGDAS